MFDRALARWAPIALLSATGLLAASAAADPRADAKAAYQRGVAAHKRGDEAAAAREFAAADAALPNATALLAALQAVAKTDDAPLAADLLDRKKREADAKVAEAAAAVEARFKDRLGWVHLDCGSAPSCDAQLGERAFGSGTDVRVAAGTHTIRVRRGEADVPVMVTVRAGGVAKVVPPETPVPAGTVAAPAPAVTAPPPAPSTIPSAPATIVPPSVAPAPTPTPSPFVDPLRTKPLPPLVVYAGGAVAVGAGVAGIAVLVHAGSKATDFEEAGCKGSTPPASSDCKGRASTGRTLDVVGNALLLGGAALGLGTVLVSAFLVDWRGKGTVSVAPVPGGAVGAYRTEF